jgi:hypothetical protein
MPRWKTDDVIGALQAEGLDCSPTPPGGDFDTRKILIRVTTFPEYSLWVTGFDEECQVPFEDPDDVEVTMVELCDGWDDRGGCNNFAEDAVTAWGKAGRVLEGLGFIVVRSMGDYF